MGRSGLLKVAALAAGLAPFGAGGAWAQAVVFVSANGNDANACSLAAPCRQIQRGVNVVLAGGEVRLLNSGGYAAATINKSVTIAGAGNTAVLSGPLTINDGGAVVSLQDIILSGRGAATDGVVVTNAAVVNVVDCVIERFVQDGLRVQDGNFELAVARSIFRDNGGHGLQVLNGGAAKVTIAGALFESNTKDGINIRQSETAIVDTVSSANGGIGIRQARGRATLDRSTVSNNGTDGIRLLEGAQMALELSVSRGNRDAGVSTDGSSIARLSNSTLTQNNFGLLNNGQTFSRRNNTIAANVTDLAGVAVVTDQAD